MGVSKLTFKDLKCQLQAYAILASKYNKKYCYFEQKNYMQMNVFYFDILVLVIFVGAGEWPHNAF